MMRSVDLLHGPHVNRTRRYKERAGFSGFPARPAKWQPSLSPVCGPGILAQINQQADEPAIPARATLLRHHLAGAARLLGEILQFRQPILDRQHGFRIVQVHRWREGQAGQDGGMNVG